MTTSEHVLVRAAQEKDHDTLTEMWVEFLEEQAQLDDRFVVADDARERWENDLPEWVHSRVHGIFVAQDSKGQLVGFSSVHLWYPAPIYQAELEAYVNEIFVRPDYRRRGIAKSLIDAVLDWANRQEAVRVRLGVLAANSQGLAFWNAVGAREFVTTMLIDRT